VSRDTFNDIDLGGIHSDVWRISSTASFMWSIARGDSIQIIDPQQGFTTPPNGELSVKSIQGRIQVECLDIAFVSPTKAYESPQLHAAVSHHPTTLTITGGINLRAKVKTG
jgi:hypothetical protein